MILVWIWVRQFELEVRLTHDRLFLNLIELVKFEPHPRVENESIRCGSVQPRHAAPWPILYVQSSVHKCWAAWKFGFTSRSPKLYLGKTVITQRHRSPETVYEVSVSTAKLNYGIQQRSQTTSYFGERVRPFSSHHRSHPNPAISFIVARLITTTIRSRSPISSP